MARLLPAQEVSEISNLPERLVAEALCEQLPQDVVVFHSYPWLRREREKQGAQTREVLREGEADFLVIHPRYGFAVIEVKGGDMFYDAPNARWDRKNATHRVKDPFDQAHKNMRALEKQITERSLGGFQNLPFARVRCVIFPQCDYSGHLPQGAEKSLLFTASDMGQLGTKIEALFKLQPFLSKDSLPQNILDRIMQSVTPIFQMVPALWQEIAQREKQVFRLTDDQARLLGFIAEHERAVIEGVAGSGKTQLAMIKARSFADAGKRVLFVCYNELLADWLNSQMPDVYRDRILIRHYHKLCRDWAVKAGLNFPRDASQDFFENNAPWLLEQAADAIPEKFDALVVDEGQDFRPQWWDGLEFLLHRPGEDSFYIFHDPAQQLYQSRDVAMPDFGKPFTLSHNCRNTKNIAKACEKAIKRTIPVRPETQNGERPDFIIASNPQEQHDAVIKQVSEWLKSNLTPRQVAIVTRTSIQKSPLADLKKIGNTPLTESLEGWLAGKGILKTSLHRFKGLEADALIVADVIEPTPDADPNGFRPEHLYVACSRAKHLLTVLGRSSSVRQWIE